MWSTCPTKLRLTTFEQMERDIRIQMYISTIPVVNFLVIFFPFCFFYKHLLKFGTRKEGIVYAFVICPIVLLSLIGSFIGFGELLEHRGYNRLYNLLMILVLYPAAFFCLWYQKWRVSVHKKKKSEWPTFFSSFFLVLYLCETQK